MLPAYRRAMGLNERNATLCPFGCWWLARLVKSDLIVIIPAAI